jgi:hypothetical protein
MQQAVDITRAMGFNGPISIPCIGYAVDCTNTTSNTAIDGGTWDSTHPTDPQNQIGAEVHWYGGDACDFQECQDAAASNTIGNGYPLILGEVGENNDNNAAPSCATHTDPVSSSSVPGYIQQAITNGAAGYFAYAWNDFGTNGVLISDLAGDPYEPGTVPTSGWYSTCVQAFSQSQPGG